MRKILTLLAAALLFAAATQSTSLLAQESTAGYYATVEKEGQDTILYIRKYAQKPELEEDKIIYVQEKELTTRENKPADNLLDEYSDLKLSPKIKAAKLEVNENFKPTNVRHWFLGFENLEKIEGLDKLNTENVSQLWSMFVDCKKLKALDLSGFNTEKVTDISVMFDGCSSLEAIAFGELNMQNVAQYMNMFRDCSSLKYIFCKGVVAKKNSTSNHDCFQNCSTLVGVAENGDNVQWTSDKIGIASLALAQDGGYFTKIKSRADVELGIKPSKTTYKQGEDLDLSGGYITQMVHFGVNDSFQMKLCPLHALASTATGFDSEEAGTKTVTLSYNGIEYSFEVEVEKPELKEVLVVSEPSLKEYKLPVTTEALKLSGGFINKVYNNDSTVEYAMDTLVFTVSSGLEAIAVGENTLVLSFDLGDTNFAWEYKINVLEEAAEDSTGSGEEPGEGGDDPIVAVEAAGFGGGAAFEAWASGCVLSVKAARGGVIEVLSVNGALVRRVEVVDGALLNLPLGKGVYVVRMGGEVKKVVVD